MTDKDAADGLKRKSSVLERCVSWVRRHIHVAFGRHGKQSVEVGFKFEF